MRCGTRFAKRSKMLGDHALQFGVGELRKIDDSDAVVLRRLAPAASRLQPEDGGGHGLGAFGGGLAEQELGDLRGRLDVAGVQFTTVMFSE